jgi:hypothetical protein
VKDVKPFFVPGDDSIRPTAWQRFVDGDWEPLEDYLDDWDQRTYLRLRSSIAVNPERARAECRLTDGSALSWAVSWRATDTGLVGAPTTVPFGEEHVELTMLVPPDRVGATIGLTRRLVLDRGRPHATGAEARWAGSILWADETVLRLAGRGAAFPSEVVDFELLNMDRRASWYLDLPSSVDAPSMGAMILLINSADTDLLGAISKSRRHSDYQRALLQAMEEGVVEELVRWAISHWDELEHAEEESVGAAARTLTNRILSDPKGWTSPDVSSMALRAAIVDGARAIGFGRLMS